MTAPPMAEHSLFDGVSNNPFVFADGAARQPAAAFGHFFALDASVLSGPDQAIAALTDCSHSGGVEADLQQEATVQRLHLLDFHLM